MKYQLIKDIDIYPIRDVLVGYWCGKEWVYCLMNTDMISVFPDYTHFHEVPVLPEKPEGLL